MYDISPALLGAALLIERGFAFLRGREWDAACLPGAADASPFAHEAPLPEEIGLNVKAIEAMHVLVAVDAIEKDGVHGLLSGLIVIKP
jgi:hypothetical protein